MEGGGGGGGVRRWPATCCSSPPRVGVLLEFARARVSKGLYRERDAEIRLDPVCRGCKGRYWRCYSFRK